MPRRIVHVDPYTITVQDPVALDGEAPYTYVLNAPSMTVAMNAVVVAHCRMQEREPQEVTVVPQLSHAGVPAPDCGYHWEDLRAPAWRLVPTQRLVRGS